MRISPPVVQASDVNSHQVLISSLVMTINHKKAANVIAVFSFYPLPLCIRYLFAVTWMPAVRSDHEGAARLDRAARANSAQIAPSIGREDCI